LAAKESNKEKPPKKPTSAFLSLIPQVQRADKKAEVRTFLGFAAAPYSNKVLQIDQIKYHKKTHRKKFFRASADIYSLVCEGKPKMRANL
jgi:hypothetical protein